MIFSKIRGETTMMMKKKKKERLTGAGHPIASVTRFTGASVRPSSVGAG